MNRIELIASINKLNREQLIKLGTVLAIELTIQARDTYVPGSTAVHDPTRLRECNEVLHRVISAVRRGIDGEEVSSSIEMIVAQLPEKEDNTPLARQIFSAFFRALQQIDVS